MLPDNERQVEVPFLLSHVKECKVLDVGKDRDDLYIPTLCSRGIQVVTCDPWESARADYQMTFQDMPIDSLYDTVVFLSSLEHFDPSEENLLDMQTDILCIDKARRILNPDGRIIVTLPFGKSRIYYDGGGPDFIQCDEPRLRYVQKCSGVSVQHEIVFRYSDGEWTPVIPGEWKLLGDLEYRANGARNAAAVYCGAWR